MLASLRTRLFYGRTYETMSHPPSSRPASPATPAAAPSLPEAQRNPWLVLVVLCLSVFMLLLDTTIVNVAQREIQIGLGADLSEIQWVLDSYILAYAVLLLSFGRLGDIFGRKKLFILGMAIFTVLGWRSSPLPRHSVACRAGLAIRLASPA